VTLRIVEQAHLSDTGRQRTANEDSFFAGSPIFAVADGMGGAQAGEVASRIAAESFGPSERGESAPEAYLRSVAVDANKRINDLAAEDESRSGMGTTFTAALMEGDDVSFAHVGDSRAYLWRDGELKLLTSDHSLVEELLRQGKLTPEQAEDHPQRSIITRALGPEAEVEVDTMTYRAKPDDVYLLCSDGLTTMVKDDLITSILGRASSLEDAAQQLVEQANVAGGRDNITVVLFRVGEGEAAPVDETATLVGPTAAEAGLSGPAVREEAARARTRPRTARAREAEAGPPRRSRGRRALKVLVVLAVLAGIVAAAVIGARQIYFLGGDEGGRLALFRGLPYDLPLGIELYSEVSSSPVQVSSLDEADQRTVAAHELRSEDDALSLIDSLESSVEADEDAGGGDRAGGAGGAGGGGGAAGDGGGGAGGGGGAAGDGGGGAGGQGGAGGGNQPGAN
jgi:protein phosphatase